MSKKKPNILIVDDETAHADTMAEALERDDYTCFTANSADEANELAGETTFDVVVTDLKMPDVSGMELLEAIRQVDPTIQVIMVTAHGSVEKAVEAMEKGAYSFMTKPVNLAELRTKVKRALEKRRLLTRVTELEEQLDREIDGMIARSPKMLRVIETIKQIAGTSVTVMVLGESGTGKELIANAIHRHSPRRDGPFVALNCAALSEGILESELFGHVKGSFTGASADRKGRFEHADGGTLFLDEVGDMPMSTQIKLLRVIEQGEIYRVGSNEPTKVDVRLVAATNQDMNRLISEGKFREDLYFRLKVVTVVLPPLRERREEIPLMVEAFVRRYALKHNKNVTGITPEARDLLVRNPWRGNVRELQNCIENMVVVARGEVLDVADIPVDIRRTTPLTPPALTGPEGGPARLAVEFAGSETGPLLLPDMSMEGMEKRLIEKALEETGGNRQEAAEKLQISERTLYRKIKQYGLS